MDEFSIIKDIKRYFGKFLFWALLFVSVYTIIAIKLMPNLCFGSPKWIDKTEGFNDILFNLAIGYIVSAIFYFIVSYLPEHKRKKRRYGL